MESDIAKFNSFIRRKFVDANHNCPGVSVDSFIECFQANPLMLARASIVQFVLEPSKSTPERKLATLEFYNSNIDGVESAIEAARAAAVFEDLDLLASHLKTARTMLNFEPLIEGVGVKFTPHQSSSKTRVSALCQCSSNTDPSFKDPPCSNPIDIVRLNSNNEIFEPPLFIDEEQKSLSTGNLSNLQHAILLLHAAYTSLSNPSSTTSIVNEQALPYIRRITESTNFSDLNILVQANALYERSILELKDIIELERGTVQLMKISKSLHSNAESEDSLKYFHQLIPLPIDTVDELAARRLVAMSDFANAIPFYRSLNKPLDVAVCLTATGASEEALEVLKSPELAGNTKAMLLRADLSSDAELWQKLWDLHKEPRAKFRLAQKAIADNNLELALQHLEDLLSCQPSNYDALNLAASSSMTLKRYEAAATYQRKCLAIKDDDTRSWSNLATALSQLDQPQSAHHAIKQAIRVNQNQGPDLPTYANFVALSAQLGLQEDVLVGLTRLAEAEGQGSQAHIARISGVLPRLVATFVRSEFRNTSPQKELLKLFTQSLPKLISPDDAMLNRLTGQVQIWAHKYQEGLASLDKAVNILVRNHTSGDPLDARSKARLQLYSQDLTHNLEKYGDQQGRIEGRTAYPGWSARKDAIERKVAALIH